VKDPVEGCVQTVLAIHRERGLGDVLVFLTSAEDIDYAIKATKDLVLQGACPGGLVPVGLHSQMSASAQLSSIAPLNHHGTTTSGGGCFRKVIYSTNVAESGVTIPNIVYVVDCGQVKLSLSCKPYMSSLRLVECSRASSAQRAGRAGRTSPGYCFRLYTPDSPRPEFTVPQSCVSCADLPEIIFQLMCLGVGNIASFEWLTPPPVQHLELALSSLWSLGLIDRLGQFTELGKLARGLTSVEPRLRRLLLLSVSGLVKIEGVSCKFVCPAEALQLVAMLQVKSVFSSELLASQSASFGMGANRRAELSNLFTACRRTLGAREGDMVSLINIFRQFKSSQLDDHDWAQRHGLDMASLRKAETIERQHRLNLERALTTVCGDRDVTRLLDKSCGMDVAEISHLICASFFETFAELSDNNRGLYKDLVTGEVLTIDRQSFIYGVLPLPRHLVYHSALAASDDKPAEMRHVSVISDKGWLLELVEKCGLRGAPPG
jgi:HrpA-like RNA helicase